MKKKLLLTLAMVFAIAMMLAFVVSADSIHNENTVDYSATVTLNNERVVNLFDSEGNALIWYLDSNNELQSIRADDERVKYKSADWTVNIYGATGPEVLEVSIVLDDTTTISSTSIVVFNIMDDDVVTNYNTNSKNLNMPVTCMKEFIRGSTNLEYVYLRLDTIAVMSTAFQNCSSLKYVNLEDLTCLGRIGGGSTFNGCSSLFAGQILDLSRTNLQALDGPGTFASVPIVGLKLPSKVTAISDWLFQSNPSTFFMYPEKLTALPANTFKNCTNLQTVYLNGSVASIGDNAFLSCNSLTTICFVGTKTQLETLISNTSATGNTAFSNVVGENNANVISYEEYLALEDKSGKYAIYNYSYCDAYNEGVHKAVDTANDCTKDADCKVCNLKGAIKAFAEHDYVEALVYESGYAKAGAYTKICQNLERCTCGNIYSEYEPLFLQIEGFATNGENGVSCGYSLNLNAIYEYNRIYSNSPLKFGVMIVNPKHLDGKSSFLSSDGKINTDGVGIQVDMSNSQYPNISVTVDGLAGDVSLIIALYAYSNIESIEYIQSQTTKCASENVTIGEQTLYTVTLASVKSANSDPSSLGDYIMPSGKENE